MQHLLLARGHNSNEFALFLKRICTFSQIPLLVDGPYSKGIHSLPPSIAGHPEHPYHALVAGAIGGYCVWGRYTSVNHQVVLYLTSRVLVGLVKRLWERIHGQSYYNSALLQHPKTYPFSAAVVWGIAMVLFEESPHVLQKSLKQSMDEIYRYQLSSNLSSQEDSQHIVD